MRYVSTRGAAPSLGFSDVLLAGLATDGGLYVPESWPSLDALGLDSCHSYAEIATAVIAPFVGDDIDRLTLQRLCDEAYATFRRPAVVPLVQLETDLWLQELFHGPTLAFKDVALQLVGRLFDHVLGERDERVTIVGATSGDTGSAAIDAVKDSPRVDIVILYPHGRTSDVQRRQMTTIDRPNVRTIAVAGTFDDCQDLVKGMFADTAFRERMRLSAVNSINWARVMAQVVYYVTASRSLRGPVTFSVPTGNFGNVLSGWIAKRMGADIAGFVVATNTNDILTRFVTANDMSTAEVVPTLSPSMDIQVSSNFERLLFEMTGRDGARTAAMLRDFRSSGRLEVQAELRRLWIDGVFMAAALDDAATIDVIARTYEGSGLLIDPHTAVGLGAVQRLRATGDVVGPVVSLATAHPAKFADAVRQATGRAPELPPHLSDLVQRPERLSRSANDLAAVEALVESSFA